MSDCPYDIRRGNLQHVREQVTDALCDLSLRIDNLGPGGDSYWTLTGDDITNNNAGSVIIANDLLVPALGGAVELMVTVLPDGTLSTEAIPGGGGGIPEAPIDDQDYVRVNASWAVADYFSGDYNDLTNVPSFATVAFTGQYGDLLGVPPPFVPTTFSGAGTTGYVPDPVVEQNYFLRDDGVFAQTPVSPIGGLFLNYRYNISTAAADPGSGKVSANATNYPLITELYANELTDPGNDADFVWQSLDPGEYIGIWEIVGDRESVYFQVSGPVVNNGGWYTIPVTPITATGSGGIDNNQRLQVFFIANPNEKVPAGGLTGQVLTKQTDNDFEDGWNTPAFLVSGSDAYATVPGNVGIGTTTPSSKFEIAGADSAANGLTVRRNTTISQAIKLYTAATGHHIEADSTGSKDLILNNIEASRSLRFQTQSVDRVIIQGGTGNVGIGTTNPAGPIEIASTNVTDSVNEITLRQNGSVSANIAFYSALNTQPWRLQAFPGGATQRFTIGLSGTTRSEFVLEPDLVGFGALRGTGTRMVTADATGNLSTQTIPSGGGGDAFWGGNLTGNIGNLNTGNVGIGTNSPTRLLQVSGSEGVVASLIGTNVNGRATIGFQGATTTGGDNQVILGALGNEFILQTSAATRLTVTAAGNVGIGNPAPGRQLAVSGTQQIVSALTSTSTTCRLGLADSATTTDAQAGIGSLGNDLQLYAGAAARVTVTGDSRMGVNVATPSETMDVNGGARVRGLAGTSTRMVTVNSTGVLSTAALPGSALTASLTIELIDNDGLRIEHSFTVQCRVQGNMFVFSGESQWTDSPSTVSYIRIKYGTTVMRWGYVQMRIEGGSNLNYCIANYVGDTEALLTPTGLLSPSFAANVTIGGSVYIP